MATRETKIPSIPAVPDGLNEDMTDFLSALKERIETREGRANDLDKVLLRRDLLKIGIDVRSLDKDPSSYTFPNLVTGEWDYDIQLVDGRFIKASEIRVVHTATEADDHALDIHLDTAGFGDVKALEIDYITGAIVKGQDEGVILINIDETAAGIGADVFGLEVLATDGDAGIYGMKVGPVIGPIHQGSGTFDDPTTATDNTPDTDVNAMKDGSTGTTTPIFDADNEYIIIGAAAAFQDLELIFTTPSSKGIKPTFWYSTAGTAQFTQFTPVDGTDGCEHTGVISWDASDLTGHVAADAAPPGTGTFDIKIIRTRNNIVTTPILGYAKVSSTTEYIWDKNGDVSIRGLTTTGGATISGTPAASPAINTLYKDNIVKGWVHFDGSPLGINDSYNVNSLTDNGIGDYEVIWDTNFANANYACVISCEGAGLTVNTANYAVGSVDVLTYNPHTAAAIDRNNVCAIALGDQ